MQTLLLNKSYYYFLHTHTHTHSQTATITNIRKRNKQNIYIHTQTHTPKRKQLNAPPPIQNQAPLSEPQVFGKKRAGNTNKQI